MCAKPSYMPAIVMIEEGDTPDGRAARDWMENSRFNTSEAADIFAALEEMGDFTMETRPDVILLDVENCRADLPIIRGTFQAIHQGEVPIMAISEMAESSTERGAFEGNLEAVVAHLDEIIPEIATV